MPRRARFCPAGYPIHVIQRGNNRQAIFTSDADLASYAHWLREGAERHDVAVHGWVFMTNHIVVKIVADATTHWPDEEVARRWMQIFTGPLLMHRYLAGAELTSGEPKCVSDLITNSYDKIV